MVIFFVPLPVFLSRLCTQMEKCSIVLSFTKIINICLKSYRHSSWEILYWLFSNKALQNNVTAKAWDWICLNKYLCFNHFTVRPCHDLKPAQLYSSPSIVPFKCFSHLFVSVAVNQMWATPCGFYLSPSRFSPLSLSSSAAFKLVECDWYSSCDCSVCPLGLKQTLPLLREGKLI